MIFTSLTFLAFFLLLLASLNIVKGEQPRIYLLLAASYIFYGWWNASFVLLIMLCSFCGWYLGLKINGTDNEKTRKLYLTISLVISLSVLGFFKYANFFANNLLMLLGYEGSRDLGILLPVGISFFTFQTMSYTIDLYWRKIPVCKDAGRFFLFVAFFPQLVAGPIVRASEFLPQLNRRVIVSAQNFMLGTQLFIGGAIQKVLIADNLAVYVDEIYANPLLYDTASLWLGVLAYAMQIFGDFAGYSLMAIGIAKILGFDLPKNFDMPYVSRSIQEFWRRWHMTLSSWLRDYLYISLGGNRKGTVRTYVNLALTMLLGGLWHGASWNFVLWGALHGGALALHRLWSAATESLNATRELLSYQLIAWSMTFLFTILCWIPFRASSFDTTLLMFQRLFSSSDGISWMHSQTLAILTISLIWHILHVIKPQLIHTFPSVTPFRFQFILTLCLCVAFIFMFAPLGASPFIYFQF